MMKIKHSIIIIEELNNTSPELLRERSLYTLKARRYGLLLNVVKSRNGFGTIPWCFEGGTASSMHAEEAEGIS